MRFASFAALTLSFGLTAGLAQAAPMEMVFTGSVYGAVDATNTFGSPIEGQNFTLTYTYDTSLGTLDTVPDGQALYGGSFWGNSSPASAVLTINGVSVNFTGNGEGYIEECGAPCFTDTVTASAWEETQNPQSGAAYTYNEIIAILVDLSGALPMDLTVPYTVLLNSIGQKSYGEFTYVNCTYGTVGCVNYTDNVSGKLSFTSMTVRALAPVPLPAGAGLLVGAVVLMGAVSRRRKAHLAA